MTDSTTGDLEPNRRTSTMTDKPSLWRWIMRLFPKKPRTERVKAMCNNCFQVIAIPAEGEWWCSDCEGKFHRIEQ